MHRVFISYHHKNNQYYRNALLSLNNNYKLHYGSPIFIDRSVNTGDIPDS